MSVNARWIVLLPPKSHLLRTTSAFTCPTVSLRWTWSITNSHRRYSVIVALPQVLMNRRAEKDLSHAQERTGKVRSSFKIAWPWVQVSVSIRNLRVCKLQQIYFATHLSLSCGRSFWYDKPFMYCFHVINYFQIYIIYKGWYQIVAIENCFPSLGKSRI